MSTESSALDFSYLGNLVVIEVPGAETSSQYKYTLAKLFWMI